MNGKKIVETIRFKRIVGTLTIFPQVILFFIVIFWIRNQPDNARLLFGVYAALFLSHGFAMRYFVDASLKRKDQYEGARGWLERLIYTLDDTYERWSGRQ